MRRRPVLVGATLVLLLAAVVGLQVVHDRAPGLRLVDESSEHLLYIQSPEVMKRAVLSYRALAADVYWIRAVQHFGGTLMSKAPGRNFDLLYPLLDIATTLDPYFKGAYRLGAIFLAEPPPGGPGQSDQAIRLLQKGLAQDPRWEYAEDIGFVYYWSRRDYLTAAEWFRRGAAMPDGPKWLESVAAATLAKGGNRESSRRLWQELLQSDADWMRRNAEYRLAQLDALDQIDALERLVQLYRQRAGTLPRSWYDVARAGLLRSVPRDPRGYNYRLNPDTGAVRLDDASTLNPLPVREGSSGTLSSDAAGRR